MRKQESDPVEEITSTCDCCKLVPVSHLDLDLGTPLAGWPASLEARGIEVGPDDVGRPSITREAFAELVAERTQRQDRLARESLERIKQVENSGSSWVRPRSKAGRRTSRWSLRLDW